MIMKKVVSFVLTLCLAFSALSIGAFATDSAEDMQLVSSRTVYLEDGSYNEILIYEQAYEASPMARATYTKTGSAQLVHKNSAGKKLWLVQVNGTFTYNGSTATCTAASTSYTIYDDAWRVTSASASKSGATAKGNFTVKKYVIGIAVSTENPVVTLTCSPSGVLS